MLSEETIHQIRHIAKGFPDPRSAVVPALHLAQDEERCITLEATRQIANALGLTDADVAGVATFYDLFTRQKQGKHEIHVCTNIGCALLGSAEIVDHIRQRLGIELGETTGDEKISLHEAECLASCGSGPMAMIDKNYFEHLTPEKVDEILDRLLAEERP